jgi:transposase
MKSIIYVGMDVHTTNYTMCCFRYGEEKPFAITEVEPNYKKVIMYMQQVEKKVGEECEFQCGYEAGSLGYSLYHKLTENGYECVILAPSTMPMTKRRSIKTDKRDAISIAKCMAYNTYSPVYVPIEEDNAVKEYIRMRDDVKVTHKSIKQQVLSFCLRHGKQYQEGRSYWTQRHLDWLGKQEFDNDVLQETYQEYLTLYRQTTDKIKMFDNRIEELSQRERYREDVGKLKCLIGVKTHTALATIVETGDFKRFKTARHYSAYLGLVPGENSSGDRVQRGGITKTGNVHIRKLLVEAAQNYSRGAVGAKPKALQKRQVGNDPRVIAYADKANERLKRKFYKIMFRSKHNIAVTAVAREMACFIWGMMTGNIT